MHIIIVFVTDITNECCPMWCADCCTYSKTGLHGPVCGACTLIEPGTYALCTAFPGYWKRRCSCFFCLIVVSYLNCQSCTHIHCRCFLSICLNYNLWKISMLSLLYFPRNTTNIAVNIVVSINISMLFGV